MKNTSKLILCAVVMTCLMMFPLQHILACPICYGATESASTDAMNMAIFSLLGVTGTVMIGIVAFFVYLRKRARLLNERFRTMLN